MRPGSRPGIPGLLIDLFHVTALNRSRDANAKPKESPEKDSPGRSSPLDQFSEQTLDIADGVFLERYGRSAKGSEYESGKYLAIARGVQAGTLGPTVAPPSSASSPAATTSSTSYSAYSISCSPPRPSRHWLSSLCLWPLLLVVKLARGILHPLCLWPVLFVAAVARVLCRFLCLAYKALTPEERARRRRAARERRRIWAEKATAATEYRYDYRAAVISEQLAHINAKLGVLAAREATLQVKLRRATGRKRSRIEAALANLSIRRDKLNLYKAAAEARLLSTQADHQLRLTKIKARVLSK